MVRVNKLLLATSKSKFLQLFLVNFVLTQVLSDYQGGRWGQGQQRWSQDQRPPQQLRASIRRDSQLSSSSWSGGSQNQNQNQQRSLRSSTTRRPLRPQDFQPPRYQFPASVTQPGPPYQPPPIPPPTSQPPGPNRPAPPLQGMPTSRYDPSSSSSEPSWSRWNSSPRRGRRGGRGGGWSAPGNNPPSPPPSSSLNDPLNPYRHDVTLDPESRFKLTWVVDWSRNLTIFNVTVRTTGWIGFGLALRTPEQQQEHEVADFIIGGVNRDGSSYFTDRHDSLALNAGADPFTRIPPIDPSQDWTLNSFWERSGRTFLSISRPLDTCDVAHDIPITQDSLRIIWAIGETDDIAYHTKNRGYYDAYLLTPDLTPREVLDGQGGQDPSSPMQVFNMTTTFQIPERETTYWCTWHRAPTNTKQHIIGFDTAFPTDQDRQHVHHLLIHRCHAPPGIDPDDLFEGPSNTGGSECYYYDTPNPLPLQYCRETMHVWGVGGRPFFFPDHVGLAMSENGTEYIVLQVHYDNPELRSDLNVTLTLQAFYTDEVREHDVSMLGIGQQIPAATSIISPPNTRGHATVGICPSACTEKGLQGQEVNILAGWLHTHTTGSASRFMHFRGDRELPWIISDDNWNFNYQQFRVLNQERRLLPGDRLSARCEYDTTRRNGSAVAGGFGTAESMCTGHVYYYPRQAGFSMCRTVTRDEDYWDLIKMRNATWDTERRQVVVTDPPEYAGLTVMEHINRNIDWTPEYIRELQRQHLFAPQVAQCSNTVFAPEISLRELNEMARRRAFLPLPPDPNAEHYAINPRNMPRYRKPQQCNARNPLIRG
ncbi:unnamed protein product [Orchesella dallaii]|uniref:DOMON domain-containing protein n=1 Tax=Orchesella dallaii TaxID=48710 RepID=A0ABP1PIL1_9HEXA